MTHKKLTLIIWQMIFSGCLISAQAGNESTPRATGMGQAQTAIVLPTDAYAWNPAALGFAKKQQDIQISILHTGGRYANNLFSVGEYNHYNGKLLTSKDRRQILSLFGGDRYFQWNMNAESRLIGAQYKNASLDVSLQTDGYVNLPKKILSMLWSDSAYLVGSEKVKMRGRGAGSVLMRTDASYGYSFKKYVRNYVNDLSLGLTVGYLYGWYNNSIRDFRLTVADSSRLISSGRYHFLESQGGNGFAVNIGAMARINERWSGGLYIQNMIGFMRWTDRTKSRTGEFDVNAKNFFSLQDHLTSRDTAHPVSAYTTYLPTLMRLGCGYQLNDKFLFAGDLEAFLADAPGHVTPRIAFGTEIRQWKNIFLRGGISIGGDNRGMSLSSGAKFLFNRWSIDVALSHLEGVFTGRRFAFAIGFNMLIKT